MSNNKSYNKSLFLYAALIFFVAVVLIILSFFGQTNLKKNQPQIDDSTEQTQSGITEKAAILSEENKTLIEENKKLKDENEELLEKQTANDLLLSANGYMSIGNTEKAFEMLNGVNYDILTSDQKIIYDNIKNSLQ